MLRINHDGSEVNVRFDHGSRVGKFISGRLLIEEERRYTKARVIFPDNNAEFEGEAVCHPCDNFCKSTGRKLALTKAMKDFDRSLRTAIWAEYHARCKPLKLSLSGKDNAKD
jgi:hypothetical protein